MSHSADEQDIVERSARTAATAGCAASAPCLPRSSCHTPPAPRPLPHPPSALSTSRPHPPLLSPAHILSSLRIYGARIFFSSTRLSARGGVYDVYKAYDEEEGIGGGVVPHRNDRVGEQEKQQIYKEVEILKQLEHKNILTFHDSFSTPDSANQIVFITEIMTSGTFEAVSELRARSLAPDAQTHTRSSAREPERRWHARPGTSTKRE